MAIRITWKNRNRTIDGTRVYRSETPMAVDALPPPVAVLPPEASEYIDNDVERNKLYYYRFGVFRGDAEAVSPERALAAMDYTGPGRLKPLRGDYALGYFGRLQPNELFEATELAGLVGLTTGSPANRPWFWLKFVRNAKILFIPSRPIYSSVSWNQLDSINVVRGLDDPNHKQVVKNDHIFIPRLIRGTGVNGTPEGSEWNDLLYPTTSRIIDGQAIGNWDYIGEFDMLPSASGGTSYRGYNTLCMEKPNASQVYSRGHGSSSSSYDITASQLVLANSAGSAYGWRPVLELVL